MVESSTKSKRQFSVEFFPPKTSRQKNLPPKSPAIFSRLIFYFSANFLNFFIFFKFFLSTKSFKFLYFIADWLSTSIPLPSFFNVIFFTLIMILPIVILGDNLNLMTKVSMGIPSIISLLVTVPQFLLILYKNKIYFIKERKEYKGCGWVFKRFTRVII